MFKLFPGHLNTSIRKVPDSDNVLVKRTMYGIPTRCWLDTNTKAFSVNNRSDVGEVKVTPFITFLMWHVLCLYRTCYWSPVYVVQVITLPVDSKYPLCTKHLLSGLQHEAILGLHKHQAHWILSLKKKYGALPSNVLFSSTLPSCSRSSFHSLDELCPLKNLSNFFNVRASAVCDRIFLSFVFFCMQTTAYCSLLLWSDRLLFSDVFVQTRQVIHNFSSLSHSCLWLQV